MKVAIIGATGFTGGRVVRELLRRGDEVVALVRPSARRPFLPTGIGVIEGDMGDDRSLGALFEGAGAFVHVASLGFGQAQAVVDAVEERRVPRSVFFSSTAVFTRLPASSKAERLRAEQRVRVSRGDWTILRPTMIYGDAGDRNMSRLIKFVSRSPVIPLPGGGRGLIQPVHVEDLGRAAVDALHCERARRREYNLPGAMASPFREVVEYVRQLLGRRCAILSLPLRPAAFMIKLWSALRLPPRIQPEQVLRLEEDKAFSYEPARQDWGYAPQGWKDGLASEIEILRREGSIP